MPQNDVAPDPLQLWGNGKPFMTADSGRAVIVGEPIHRPDGWVLRFYCYPSLDGSIDFHAGFLMHFDGPGQEAGSRNDSFHYSRDDLARLGYGNLKVGMSRVIQAAREVPSDFFTRGRKRLFGDCEAHSLPWDEDILPGSSRTEGFAGR